MKILTIVEAQRRQNLQILFVAGLLFWSGLASLLPALPQYVEDVGGTKQQVGIVMGSFAIGLLLLRTTLGRMADQRSRKLVVIIGASVAAIAPLGYLFVHSIAGLIALRAFHGVSIAAFTTGYSALVVDLSPVDKRGELIGYMSLVNPIGMALGPAIGGFLQAGVGYTPLFLFAGGLGGLSLLFTSQVSEPEREVLRHSATSDAPSTSMWRLVLSPRLRVAALVFLLVGLSFGALGTFVALFIRESGVNLNPGLFFTAAAIASFSLRIFSGPASDKYGRGLFITGSLVCYGIAMFVLSQANSPQAFLLAGFIEGAGSGMLIPMMVALISDRSFSNERGRVFAICVGGFDLGIAIAGPVFGAVAEVLTYRGIFSLATGLAGLALVVFMTQCNKNLSSSLRFALGRDRDLYAVDHSKFPV
ncbi:MAG TPA: MFS transporter [Coleofasciculaceae cyanobacterium]